jgi:hypothetical protein
MQSALHAPCRHPGCVVSSDVRVKRDMPSVGPFVYCDVQDKDNLARIILENGVDTIVHLATLLSGEALDVLIQHAPARLAPAVNDPSGLPRPCFPGLVRSLCFCSHWRAQPSAGATGEHHWHSGAASYQKLNEA